MNISKLTYALQNPDSITAEDASLLNEVTTEYPYFQAAKALFLKSLYLQDSFKYNNHLKHTAAYTTDRVILFEFIKYNGATQQYASKKITAQQSGIKHIEVEAEEINAQHFLIDKEAIAEADKVLDPDIFQPKETAAVQDEDYITETPEKQLQIGKPINFNSEVHSFSEWLKLSAYKPIDRTHTEKIEKKPTEKESEEKEIKDNQPSKFDLIDKFLKENPKITPSKETSNTQNLAEPSYQEKSYLMTETLARVYLEQRKYKKAIQAYQILILKYPEKSGFFADQIKAIKKLQQNN